MAWLLRRRLPGALPGPRALALSGPTGSSCEALWDADEPRGASHATQGVPTLVVEARAGG